MQITFELWASLERLAGATRLQVRVPAANASIGDAIAILQREHPALAGAVERCACAVGDTIVRRRQPLPMDGQIALLPPVAGG